MEEPLSPTSAAGATLVERLEQKYCEQTDDLEAASQELDGIQFFYNVASSSPSKAARLELIVLNHMQIHSLGDVHRFASLVQHVREVDIAWNALSCWSTIGRALRCLPHLRALNLAHNPLGNPSTSNDQVQEEIPWLPQLQSLVLNGTGIQLDGVRWVLSRTPTLGELHLSFNDFSTLSSDPCTSADGGGGEQPISDSVHTLYATNCRIDHWNKAARLAAHFPARHTLVLCENPIQQLDLNDDRTRRAFEGVRVLSMSRTAINEWTSIDELARLDSLREIRIQGTPLLETLDEEQKMHLVIARIPQLRVMNLSSIHAGLREDAERFFIRHYRPHDKRPPIYEELVAKHGNVEELVHVDLTPQHQATVSIVCEDTAFAQTMRVRLDRTVAQFMRFMEKKTGIAVSRQRVFHLPLEMDPSGPTELRLPGQLLRAYHIQDGDTLLVQSKLVTGRRRQASSSAGATSSSSSSSGSSPTSAKQSSGGGDRVEQRTI